MPKTFSKLLSHPLLWRFTGFVSSIVGFSCYALSPSFQDLFGHWNPLKIVIYGVVSTLLSILMLFVTRCSRGLGRSFLLKAHAGFLVLMLTSLYSFFEDRSEEGKVDQEGYGKVMNLTSTGAFAMMAMSLSRQLELGFELGVFNFFLGCFLVTVMKMNFKFAPVAALFCYLLVNIRSFSDFLLEIRGRGATEDCCEDEARLLVEEHMEPGNLEEKLFKGCLPWLTRIKIATEAAKALAFRHEQEPPVIYGDVKASNILLDADYNAKLSDVGLEIDGQAEDQTRITTRAMRTYGYAAPEYITTGHWTTMSDVYSFGVVLLELLTGKRCMDMERPIREQNLVEWARPVLKDPHKVERIIDPRLEGQYSTEGARRLAALAYKCLSHEPNRPSTRTVVKTLKPLMDLTDFPVGHVGENNSSNELPV